MGAAGGPGERGELRVLARSSAERDRRVLAERLAARAGGEAARGAVGSGPAARPTAPGPRQWLREQLIERLVASVEGSGSGGLRDPELARARVRRVLTDLSGAEAGGMGPSDLRLLEDELVWEIGGLGPLGPLFADPTVSDILVNGPHEVWVDRFGRLTRTGIRFDDEEHLLRLLKRLVGTSGRHVDEASPLVDVRLPDGSRLHAAIPPVCRAGPVVSIRRFRRLPFRLAELLACGTLSEGMAGFLQAAVAARLNLVVSGGAAAGKTTLLNVLSGFIPPGQRVVTIEETAELQLDHPHVIPLESRMANTEGRGEISLRRLVVNALRMRADRIIVGEVRGAEVFDMLQAMNAGHDGSLTTVHANSPEDALRRIEALVVMGGFELSVGAIRDLLGAAFQVIVQMSRLADGSRRVSSIAEVVYEGGELGVRELFRFEPGARHPGEPVAGFRPTAIRPAFHRRLAEVGYAPTGTSGDDSQAMPGRTAGEPDPRTAPGSPAPNDLG